MTPQLKEGFNNGIMHVRAHSSIQEGSTKSRQSGIPRGGPNGDPRLVRPPVSFAESVKRGIQSFSPFRQHIMRNEDDGDGKKSAFGPPKIPLNDDDLEDIYNQT